MTIRLVNESGMIKDATTGFSWTTLFFGSLVPLFRSDWKYFVIMCLVGMLTLGFSNLVFSFTYNKTYMRERLNEGYKPTTDADANYLRKIGLML